MRLPRFAGDVFVKNAIALAGLVLLTVFAQPVQAQAFDPAEGIHTYFEKVKAYDFLGWSQLFTPDGILEDPVGTPPHQGQAALFQFLTAIASESSLIDYDLGRVVVSSPTDAAAQWNLHITLKNGGHLELEGIGAFTFNNEGKLQHVREYWDLAGYIAQHHGETPEPPVFHFDAELREWFASAGDLDVKRHLDLYAADPVLASPVGVQAYVGAKAIKEHAKSFRKLFSDMTFTIVRIMPVTDTQAAVEWTVEAPTKHGDNVVRLGGLSFFRYDEEGKVVSVDEYWSIAELLGQL
jgi:steroid delta-isomerase